MQTVDTNTAGSKEQTPESGRRLGPIELAEVKTLVLQCFQGDVGPADHVLRHVMAAVAHDLEVLAYGCSEMDHYDVERALIIAYNRLQAGLDLDALFSRDQHAVAQ